MNREEFGRFVRHALASVAQVAELEHTQAEVKEAIEIRTQMIVMAALPSGPEPEPPAPPRGLKARLLDAVAARGLRGLSLDELEGIEPGLSAEAVDETLHALAHDGDRIECVETLYGVRTGYRLTLREWVRRLQGRTPEEGEAMLRGSR